MVRRGSTVRVRFYAYLMGWQRIAVYDGGWLEWSQDPTSNPIEVGVPQDELAA